MRIRRLIVGAAVLASSIGVAGVAEAGHPVYVDCEVGCRPVPNLTPPTTLVIFVNGPGTTAQKVARARNYGCGTVSTWGVVVGYDCDY